ncbi:hypothetical protein EJB10_03725 [Wolbachia endosymbiont of Brugia malayi]|uniref:hypothetical protein n=1 Tax=Wolbachia endosymbiont of Brugia malayi TaxID=80849 RepID=UPI000300D473|nr:hypothetical protein [Wolbachia endosymbiont of Brugia malayi]QCB61840.1 hypothetical protein EJB10_03725 [Wolbachia endosymbiont of Brugia malayi]
MTISDIVKFDDKTLESDEVHSFFTFFTIYILIFTILSVVMSYLSNTDFITSISSAYTTLTNSGPEFSNLIGYSGNYSFFSGEVKLSLSFLMLLEAKLQKKLLSMLNKSVCLYK